MLAILLIPAALCFTFGGMVGDRRPGLGDAGGDARPLRSVPCSSWASAEQSGNPVLAALGVDQAPVGRQPGGNMEGKELRFGIARPPSGRRRRPPPPTAR